MVAVREGNLEKFFVTFRTDGKAVDPGVVNFAYQSGVLAGEVWTPGGPASSTTTYASATVPAVGVIARTGVGRYETWVDVTSLGGWLAGKWWSTGAGQAETWDYVEVETAPF